MATSYVRNVPGNPGYEFVPMLKVGDEVPLIEGTVGNFQTLPGRTFAFAGIPDGMGVYETANNYYLFLNHEIAAVDSRRNPLTSAISSTVPGIIQGARVSLYVFDKNWNIIGGKNLIERAVDPTGEYVLNTATGTYVNAATGGNFSFTRFCSAYLAESGFVDANGQSIPVYFIPEETTDNATTGASTSRGWALSPDGTALAIEGLGRYAKENVTSASQYRATNSDKTVIFGAEDFANGELYMFVGQQTAQDPNGFQDGQLYVLRLVGHEGETLTEGVKTQAFWVPVPKDIALDPTGAVLSSWVDSASRSTNFRRLEDIHEDPNNPGTFYFVTTGTNDKLGGGTTNNVAEAENPYGKMYRFSLNPNDPTGQINNFEMVLDGGFDTGVSYDNIVVDKKGKVLIQEDETAFGGDVMEARAREAGIWEYDIATDQITFVAELNESAAGEQYDDTSTPGEWESSGIIELGSGRQFYLFDVQAHTIKDSNYVEGGQLIMAIWKGPDSLTAKGGEFINGFQGDDTLSGSASSGNNTLRGGQDDDVLIGGAGDVLLGDNGNDFLLPGKANNVNGNLGNDFINAANNLGGSTLHGGQNDDTIISGVNDLIFGDKGNDVLFAGAGPNTLIGGADADQFWMVNTNIPVAPSTIADFQPGTDVIGFSNLGVNSISSLTITQRGADAVISFLGNDLAIVANIQASVLTSSSFVFT
ncbi:alkaline phosphatase PhoX [Aerosakkonemataceae cyanobacterium BLCC-F154]|uniref:Alkaline phosphatase PhoX n=1 Tax=Floridaenema fluviatile BLCC-F154 TaxID=3153640 RepID=A0ABV4Y8F9_9CYAN